MGLLNILRHSWNAFMNRDPTYTYRDIGPGYSHRPDRTRLTRGNERTIVTSIANRIALDVSALNFCHCIVDDNGRFISNVESELNNCLSLEANIDQTGRCFIQDVVLSMFDEGAVAIVPVETDDEPSYENDYDISSLRTGKIVKWHPQHVTVRVYDELTSVTKEITLPKRSVAIIENPLYAVMNEPNSTMQRLVRKLALLDSVDEQSSSGKLDLIVQLPYTVKTEMKREIANKRKKDIEDQLTNSTYGIAYIDSTEKITQLNRPIENNLLKQVEYLTNLSFSQLGITQSVLDNTANEQEMLNYYSRITEPIAAAIADGMKRTFLSKNARSQKQTIAVFRDPFKLVPISHIAEIADKFTRNEIMTSNEIRQIIGMKPSDDPKADRLENSNLNHPDRETISNETIEGDNQNG